MRRVRLVGMLVLAAACGDNEASTRGVTTSAGTVSGSITVSAASSLTEAFEKIADEFEAANPGSEVTLSFDSSSTLSQQIIDGAPVDAFASADEANMTKLVDAGKIIGEPTVIATNSLMIVVKPGNPRNVQTLADLVAVDFVSLCGQNVPCGRFAQQVLDAAGVSIPSDKITRGQNVKATVAAVAEGDADAGIVYVTDVQSAGDTVEGITIPTDQNVVAVYPMAAVSGGDDAVARAFVEFVAGPRGQETLREFGFSPS